MLPPTGATRAVLLESEFNTKLSFVVSVPNVTVNNLFTVKRPPPVMVTPFTLLISRLLTLPIPVTVCAALLLIRTVPLPVTVPLLITLPLICNAPVPLIVRMLPLAKLILLL